MNIFDSISRSSALSSLPLSSLGRKPVWILREFTIASLASSLRSRLSLLISSENTATTLPSRIAAFCAMLIASAVLPIEGRAAITINSDSCNPLVIRSKSM